jgi:hypothetical protein
MPANFIDLTVDEDQPAAPGNDAAQPAAPGVNAVQRAAPGVNVAQPDAISWNEWISCVLMWLWFIASSLTQLAIACRQAIIPCTMYMKDDNGDLYPVHSDEASGYYAGLQKLMGIPVHFKQVQAYDWSTLFQSLAIIFVSVCGCLMVEYIENRRTRMERGNYFRLATFVVNVIWILYLLHRVQFFVRADYCPHESLYREQQTHHTQPKQTEQVIGYALKGTLGVVTLALFAANPVTSVLMLFSSATTYVAVNYL